MLKIQELRVSAGLTQRELAAKIGVKNYTVANWEQGRTEPSIGDLIDLANYFDCSVDYLIGRTDEFEKTHTHKSSKANIELVSLFEKLTPDRKKNVLLLIKDLKNLTDTENL